MAEKNFVLVGRVPPPKGVTIFARTGNAYFDAAYSRWSNKWWHLHNGRETEIAAPTWWYCPEDYAKENCTDDFIAPVGGKPKQSVFSF